MGGGEGVAYAVVGAADAQTETSSDEDDEDAKALGEVVPSDVVYDGLVVYPYWEEASEGT